MEKSTESGEIKGFDAWEEEVEKHPRRQTGPLYEAISQDPSFLDAVRGCIECGNCTATCPVAAEADYDPKEIIMVMFHGYDGKILDHLRDKIYHCVQCNTCLERCPRENQPPVGIAILRELARARGLCKED